MVFNIDTNLSLKEIKKRLREAHVCRLCMFCGSTPNTYCDVWHKKEIIEVKIQDVQHIEDEWINEKAKEMLLERQEEINRLIN